MKRICLIITALFLALGLRAQEVPDSTAVYDVFDSLSVNVVVRQSPEVHSAMTAHVDRNARRMASGLAGQTYRIRIFFDSGQNARSDSEAAAAKFRKFHPGVPVSRTFTDPFFKVTVGDFRTKSEAMQLLDQIKGSFPSAFIVKETINYPTLGSIR